MIWEENQSLQPIRSIFNPIRFRTPKQDLL